MHTIKAIGLDTAKSVFQVHGVDAEGQVVVRRQLKRRYVLALFERHQRSTPIFGSTSAFLAIAPIRRHEQGNFSAPAEPSLYQRSKTSIGEIDNLIGELQTLRSLALCQ